MIKFFKQKNTTISIDYSVQRVKKIGNSKVSIGRYSYGDNLIKVQQWKEGASLQIGSFCSIAKGVTFLLGGNHRTDWISTYPFGHVYANEMGINPVSEHPKTNGDIIINDDVWIGQNSTILSGVKVGAGAVIAANSTVVKNVLPYKIYGGNPAKLIKPRFNNQITDLLLMLKWWELDIEEIKKIHPILCSEPSEKAIKKLLSKYR